MGGAIEGLRPRIEWLRTGVGEHSNPPAGYSGTNVQGSGIVRGTGSQAFRIFSGRVDVWHAAARGNCLGDRPRGDAAVWGEVHSRGDCICKDDGLGGFDGGIAKHGGERAVGSLGKRAKAEIRSSLEQMRWINCGL